MMRPVPNGVGSLSTVPRTKLLIDMMKFLLVDCLDGFARELIVGTFFDIRFLEAGVLEDRGES